MILVLLSGSRVYVIKKKCTITAFFVLNDQDYIRLVKQALKDEKSWFTAPSPYLPELTKALLNSINK